MLNLWFSISGDFAPQGCFAMSEDTFVFTATGECYLLHIVSRGQGCWKKQSPTAKNYPVQNFNCYAKVEALCAGTIKRTHNKMNEWTTMNYNYMPQYG